MSRVVPAGITDLLVASGYRLGWRLVRLLPERLAYRLFDAVADAAVRRDGRGARRLRANLARAVPGADGAQLDAVVRDGMRSYLRYWCDAFRLQDWDEHRRVSTVRTEGDEVVRAALGGGRGVVGALGHLGNWDHAGAWSRSQLAPVTTVAERLRPEAVFRRFVDFRRDLGIEILAHDPAGDRGPEGVTVRLTERLREGAFVPLLADRDLSGRGVRVDLLGEPARVASGPAVLAARSGALLVPIGITYERRSDSPSGWGTVVTFHPPVDAVDDSPTMVQAAMQTVADRLGESIRTHPEDWHMLQTVFEADLVRRG